MRIFRFIQSVNERSLKKEVSNVKNELEATKATLDHTRRLLEISIAEADNWGEQCSSVPEELARARLGWIETLAKLNSDIENLLFDKKSIDENINQIKKWAALWKLAAGKYRLNQLK